MPALPTSPPVRTTPTVSPLEAEAQPTAPPGSTVVAGGCGSTQVFRGGTPGWLMAAAGGETGLADVPYVMAHPALAGGFLFNTYPFRIKGGQLSNQGNKVLWAVRTPRNNGPLTIVAHPLGASTPFVRETRPADSSPGEIYPDGIDVPIPGCWEISLKWPTGQTQVELNYVISP
jgi:hypothetical protein